MYRYVIQGYRSGNLLLGLRNWNVILDCTRLEGFVVANENRSLTDVASHLRASPSAGTSDKWEEDLSVATSYESS